MPVKKKGIGAETTKKMEKNEKKSNSKSSGKKAVKQITKSSSGKTNTKKATPAITKKSSASKNTSKRAPKTVKKTTMSRKRKKNDNLSKLCIEMNKLAKDAVDKEITKRFKTLIDTADDDITKTALRTIMKDSKNVEFSKLHESLHPYVKHYIFMLKRNNK